MQSIPKKMEGGARVALGKCLNINCHTKESIIHVYHRINMVIWQHSDLYRAHQYIYIYMYDMYDILTFQNNHGCIHFVKQICWQRYIFLS